MPSCTRTIENRDRAATATETHGSPALAGTSGSRGRRGLNSAPLIPQPTQVRNKAARDAPQRLDQAKSERAGPGSHMCSVSDARGRPGACRLGGGTRRLDPPRAPAQRTGTTRQWLDERALAAIVSHAVEPFTRWSASSHSGSRPSSPPATAGRTTSSARCRAPVGRRTGATSPAPSPQPHERRARPCHRAGTCAARSPRSRPRRSRCRALRSCGAGTERSSSPSQRTLETRSPANAGLSFIGAPRFELGTSSPPDSSDQSAWVAPSTR